LARAQYDGVSGSAVGPAGEGDVHRGRTHRSRMSAERSLPANPATCRDGALEHCVHLPALSPCCLIRSANLTQDLRLTQNLGLESSRYAEHVPNRCLPIGSGESRAQLDPPIPREVTKPPLEVIATGPVDLESVAGR